MRLAIKEELCTFAQNTSVKGVSTLYKADTAETKMLLTIGVIICLTVGDYQAYWLFAGFFSSAKVTQIKEHHFDDSKDMFFPNIQICNLNPTGLLRNLPTNESLETYYEIVRNLTKCSNCSEKEMKLMKELEQEMSTIHSYIEFIGVKKSKNLFHNISNFLLEYTVFPSKTSCFDTAKTTVQLSYQFFSCIVLEFPNSFKITAVDMIFYTGDSDAKTFMTKNQWAMTSSGIVYDVIEQGHQPKVYIPFKTAPPGVKTFVYFQKEITTRLSAPYGNCVPCAEDNITNDSFVCTNQCWEEGIKEKCSCLSDANLVEDKETQGLDYCYSIHQSREQLINNYICVKSMYSNVLGGCLANCKTKCVTTTYTTGATYSK